MKILKTALTLNAGFSFLAGITLVLFHAAVANLFGVDNTSSFWTLGIVLLGFATFVYLGSRKLRFGEVLSIIIQDILWVIASAVVVAFRIFSLSKLGYAIIVYVALIVLGFAIVQSIGLRQMKKAERVD